MNFTMISTGPSEWFRWILISIFLLILLIGLLGNTLVLLSVLADPINLHHSSTNPLLLNMSIADLLILIFNIFDIVQFSYDTYWPTAWYLGFILCKIVRFGQVFGCYASVQTLLAISIERYISIVHPIKISPLKRRNRLYLTFILIWSVGFLFALPNLYFLKLHVHPHRLGYFICGLSDSYLIRFYKYTESICFFFLPALIQTILYLIVCHKIFLVDRVVQSQQCDSNIQLTNKIRSQTGNRARKKAITMLLIVAIVYFLSFSPAQIMFIHMQLNKSQNFYEHRVFFLIAILLALSSTAINPILFYIFSKFFRCKFNCFLRRLFGQRLTTSACS